MPSVRPLRLANVRRMFVERVFESRSDDNKEGVVWLVVKIN